MESSQVRSAECGVRNEVQASAHLQLSVSINGQPRELHGPITLAELLEQLPIPQRGVAIEVNLQVVPRTRHGEVTLADGDRVEIVSLVGGG